MPSFKNEKELAKEAQKPEQLSLFDKICSGDIPANVIYEDEKCMAFTDVNPQAKTHFLVIPKTAYKNGLTQLSKAGPEHQDLLGHLMVVVSKLANDEKNGLKQGYRVVINDGVEGCQSVYHLHIHVIGG